VASQPAQDLPPFAAIVLAGGRAQRLGGADKPSIVIGGRSLVSAVVTATISAGAARVVIVGPVRRELLAGPVPGIEITTEQPPGGGPVAGLRAGLGLVTEPWLLLLAADLPFLTGRVLRTLLAAAGQAPGAVTVDAAGHQQWLTSCWRVADLRAALAEYRESSLRGVLGALPHAEVTIAAEPGEPPFWLDCDTPGDLAAADQWARRGQRPGQSEQNDRPAQNDRGVR
jgi:molybdopterin-guanine dinucleotide biosynthesis protein A